MDPGPRLEPLGEVEHSCILGGMITVVTSSFLGLSLAVSCMRARPAGALFAVDEEPIRSVLHGPLFLGEAPPELRTLGAIWIPHAGVEGVPDVVQRDREGALEIAHDVIRRLRDGEDWYRLANEYSASRNRATGSVLGSYPRGVLAPDFDAFLFSSEIGSPSEPVSNERGVFVLQRMETYAACRVIAVRGTVDEAWEQARALAQRARDGEDFAKLAKEHSSHVGSAERGGAWNVFERGPNDNMMKLEAFRAKVGDVVGPLEILGTLFVVKRVPLDEIDPSLAEDNWIRVRALSLAFDGAQAGLKPHPREMLETMELALELRDRILEGEDMVELIEVHDDDPTGATRGGDLGWIHRRTPGLARPIQRMFSAKAGEVSEPVHTEVGVFLLRREA